MIIVALRTRLRHGELIGLRWIDVDLDAGRLVVRQAVSEGGIGTAKNGRTREVPLCKQALETLRDRPRSGQYASARPTDPFWDSRSDALAPARTVDDELAAPGTAPLANPPLFLTSTKWSRGGSNP